ncbi:hypothetical protein SAMN04487936_102264 [Halobacillus dabanensis]|uniref:DUF4829 domain-containing protein n=1 Tax=Halobacillus dabanensis TaxID=240302 RepID=A0A1I3RHV2_HALDA|nr:hypothetical protein [Halobacillus dabanensis]SFJ46184.1 hypothetical protein SAMN04487936_102264 [Halobacillus dabanensis]
MKKSNTPKIFLLFLFLALVAAIAITFFILTRPSHQASNTVEQFYGYEQQGKFSDSWELFHPQMREKFSKGHYIQDRAHVFMNHFGVETFEFTIGDIKKIDQWKMEKGAKPLTNVYHTVVIQTFKGKYGQFRLHQDLYVVKEKEEWRILWDYNK